MPCFRRQRDLTTTRREQVERARAHVQGEYSHSLSSLSRFLTKSINIPAHKRRYFHSQTSNCNKNHTLNSGVVLSAVFISSLINARQRYSFRLIATGFVPGLLVMKRVPPAVPLIRAQPVHSAVEVKGHIREALHAEFARHEPARHDVAVRVRPTIASRSPRIQGWSLLVPPLLWLPGV